MTVLSPDATTKHPFTDIFGDFFVKMAFFGMKSRILVKNSINPALGFGVNNKHTYFLPDGLAQN